MHMYKLNVLSQDAILRKPNSKCSRALHSTGGPRSALPTQEKRGICFLCARSGHMYLCGGVCKCCKEHAASHGPVCASSTYKAETLQVTVFNQLHCVKEANCCYLLTCNHRLHTFAHTSHIAKRIERMSGINTPPCNIYMYIPQAHRNVFLCMRHQLHCAQVVHVSERRRKSILKPPPCSLGCIAQLQIVAGCQLTDVCQGTAARATKTSGCACALVFPSVLDTVPRALLRALLILAPRALLRPVPTFVPRALLMPVPILLVPIILVPIILVTTIRLLLRLWGTRIRWCARPRGSGQNDWLSMTGAVMRVHPLTVFACIAAVAVVSRCTADTLVETSGAPTLYLRPAVVHAAI